MEIYLVGGAVRDELLGRSVTERDWVVVGATPEQMQAQGYQKVGKDFPVFLHPETKEEYALARTERKTGKGYTGFSCHADVDVTLEEDLLRRDLTINAMAKDPQGHIIDPYGGLQDLEQSLLRHVSPAFVEDPLRVLRVARFAARYAELGFKLVPETQALLVRMVAQGDLSDLVTERVWKETERSLSGTNPQVFFQVLRDCGALAVLFPELDHLFGVPSVQGYLEVDMGVHTLLVLQQAAQLTEEIAVRFAALVHDFGKAIISQEKWVSHYGNEESGVSIVEAFCERMRVPKALRDLGVLVARYHLRCHRALALSASELLDILNATDVFRRPQRFEHFLLACEADARAGGGLSKKAYPQGQRFYAAYKAANDVSTKDIVSSGLAGDAIGQALYQRRLEAIKHALGERG